MLRRILARCAPPALLALTATASLTGQPAGTGVPPEVQRAQALLRANDPAEAARVLEQFFAHNPSATAGRLVLGQAYRQAGDLERALTAFLAVTTPRPVRLSARYAAAAVAATLGRRDQAFELLRELKASGAFDLDSVRTGEAFAGLRGDPRYPSVLFRPEEFADPFVEPVRVIHQWVAETKGDQFSWIARGIGDVDGDRASEVVTSAPTYGAGGAPAGPGRVYLYSGRSGRLLWTRTGTGTEGLGIGLEGAGDANGDGVPDVIAGAPGGERAYLLSGKDGAVLQALRGDTAGERFGSAASGVGDLDGDGRADVAVGAPGAGQGAGRVYLFSGATGARLAVLRGDAPGAAFGSIVAGVRKGSNGPVVIGAPGAGPGGRGRVTVHRGRDPNPRFVIEADSTGVALGAMFVSVVGDLDGDGTGDIYASDFPNAAKGPSTGRVYLRSGADGRPLYTLTGEGPGDAFGVGPADLGDIDRDGHDDLIIGAWQHSSAAASGGKIYLYSGKNGTLIRTITGKIQGETLGFDAAGIGDLDGDGVVDLLVTSSWSNVKGFRSGRMWVIAGGR